MRREICFEAHTVIIIKTGHLQKLSKKVRDHLKKGKIQLDELCSKVIVNIWMKFEALQETDGIISAQGKKRVCQDQEC